jgi:hypothetical protein
VIDNVRPIGIYTKFSSKGGVFCLRPAYLTTVTSSYDVVDATYFRRFADQLFPLAGLFEEDTEKVYY